MCGLLFLLFAIQNEFSDPYKVLQFADHLYTSRDYAAALQEYRRYRFLADSIPLAVREKTINCYLQTGQYTKALSETAFLPDSDYRAYITGYILYKKQRYDSSRIYLQDVGVPYRQEAHILFGLGYAQTFQFTEASRYIEVPGDLPEYKSIPVGALFSLFPGGGHLYCGRIGDGLFSCAVVTLSAALAYYYKTEHEDLKFTLSLSAAILLYSGNIYGGINAVQNYNYYVNDRYRNSIIELNKPDDPFLH